MNIDLTNKNVLVTGASRGIGAAIALQMAQSGAKVALHGNNHMEHTHLMAKECGNGSMAFKADLSKESGAASLFNDVVEAFGRLDVIVNNAGIALSSELSASDADWLKNWNATIAVNLTSVGILCKKCISHFIDEKIDGIVINISSRAAFRGDTADYIAYAASKGGVTALTKSLARAYGKNNITAFGIAPGFTKTDMAQDFIDAYGEKYVIDDIALNELTQPEDIANTAVFLASGLAKHATGTTIDINAASYVR